ncbi:hypothetical protein BJV85_002767 [Clostridium acetobutylicum]|uniref:DUF3892 domain-containing protein n=1 Tax=Clostridium acetobutylicum (strain ATCC 824 / DSM 792 / JCM 1419 / IAM 19013 / LMG 5710 / NBRC 13948 / NRRL B-527 / VKM B-1787 / 2291 / W) TaxID=272562 RepID=Q97JP3_CLOAB|nr:MULTISPECIES: DUF3892 domain-containing protein [Clostridium]AAK79202.1 Hypothetical protein CA_C1230 [Clostridium acetobutylicum ATCC 824]AEI31729.1 hypothetical protein SMB_G1251 [Clostridium acetobutylicum DSM 1731]AWV81548.1 DUF3892 domain-containing protein [Clostridium acetobutylicum]MBC2393188.1 DUF3892 domain-containing protein [Clostridium acetobutylicum]MBC2583333.1 DUF3892 domain-containing protein [Clostridium acetobutylicum]
MKNVYDYGIYAVRYDGNDKNNLIQSTKVCFIKDNNVSMPVEFSRDFLIADIEDGNKYYTMYKNNNKWERREIVSIEYIKGNPYVKIRLDGIEGDDLGELPNY